MRFRHVPAIALLFAGWSATAHAQVVVPPAADPGRIDQRLQPPATPQSTPKVVLDTPDAITPPRELAGVKVKLASVIIEGSTVYRPSDFEPLYAQLIGKEVTITELYALRDAITAKYRSAGYLLSRATIPPQNITDGIFHIRIVEGYISKVSIEGRSHERRKLIASIADRVTRSRPLRAADLERAVLLISDLPGVAIRTVIRPSTTDAGAAELSVIVEREAATASIQADNRGSRAIGPEEVNASVQINSLLGLDERTYLQVATVARSRELAYFALGHDEVLTAQGLKLALRASTNRSHPAGALSPLDPVGQGETMSAILSDPLIRTRSQSLNVSAGFTYLNNRLNLLGVRFNNDRVRYLSLGAAYDFADTRLGFGRPASTLIQGEVQQGLNILHETETGSPDLSRANGHSDFTLLHIDATRLQTIAPRWSVALSLSGQVAGTPLLVSQQFGLGGSRFGRGYEPSEITGDNGVAGSVEGRYDPSWLRLPATQSQFYAFYDAGAVWLKSPAAGQSNEMSLASAGLGIRFRVANRFTAEFEAAKPLTRPIASRGNKDVRPLFSLATTF